MYGLVNLELYLYFILFLIAIFFSWFIPGWVVLNAVKIKETGLQFLLSIPVGMALWGVQGFLFGYTQVRFLTFVYLAVFAYLFWKKQKETNFFDINEIKIKLKTQKKLWILLIVLGSLIQIFGHIGSGLVDNQGLAFYFVNSVDGVLHLSYIQELAQRFPPHEPGAVGLPLINYHYWSDLVQAELIRVWKLPTIHVFFQYAPILIAIWTTILFLKLVAYLGGNKKAQIVALFLLTFGGDAAYLITQILHGHWGENVSSLDSGVTFYFNIPQVYARLVLIAVIFLLLKWLKNRSLAIGALLSIVTATQFGFKVYYAIYAVLGFCSLVTFEIISDFIKNIKNKSFVLATKASVEKNKKSLLLVIFMAIISLTFYLPVNKNSGGLTYSFFEWPKLLLSSVNIDYIDWFLRMQVYEAHANTRNIIIYNLWAVLLTFIAVYGTRMLGMWPHIKTKNENLKKLFIFFIPANIVFILLGLFSLQTSGGLNIFNFLIVPIFSFNIFAAITLSQLKTKFFVPVFIIFAVLTVPRSFLQLSMFSQRYVNTKPDQIITHDELDAFAYLRKLDHVVVQKSLSDLYNYQTMYVAFLSNQPTYIGGISMLESHNQPTNDRESQIVEALAQTDSNLKVDLLRNLGITHFILSSEEFNKPNAWLLEPVFQNNTITILAL